MHADSYAKDETLCWIVNPSTEVKCNGYYILHHLHHVSVIIYIVFSQLFESIFHNIVKYITNSSCMFWLVELLNCHLCSILASFHQKWFITWNSVYCTSTACTCVLYLTQIDFDCRMMILHATIVPTEGCNLIGSIVTNPSSFVQYGKGSTIE